MADLADIAQSEENQDRDAAILAALAPPAGCEAGPCWIDGSPHCRVCESPIPAKRLEAIPGTGLCVFCAAEAQDLLAAARRTSGRETLYFPPSPTPTAMPAFLELG